MSKKNGTFLIERNCFAKRKIGVGSIIELEGEQCKITNIHSVHIGQSKVKIFGNYVHVIEELEED